MPREIKFRAFDKELKKMVKVISLNFPEWSLRVRLDATEKNYNGYSERHSFKNEETDRFILMQFTGLKDKNGKEIYEGDILECEGGTSTVEFLDGGFWFSERNNWLDDWNWPDDSHRFKIIGNIYESPELVK